MFFPPDGSGFTTGSLDELLDEELLEEVVVDVVELLVVVVVVVVELAVELLEALEKLPADDEPVVLVENGVVCCDEGRELFRTEDSSDVLCGVDVSGSVELSDAEFFPVEELFPEKVVLSDRDAFPASTMFTDPLSPPREQPPSTHIATASDIAAKIFFFIFCSPIFLSVCVYFYNYNNYSTGFENCQVFWRKKQKIPKKQQNAD